MLKKLRKNNSGFTIIEVLIVLAIGGLIMLIVFLAVPALQRNNRNTQRRNDVANLLGGVAEWASNHNGALPDSTQLDGLANTAYYSGVGTAAGNFTVVAQTTNPPTITAVAANDRVIVSTGARCNGSTATQAGSARQVAALFLVETSNGYDIQCQES